VKNDAKIEAYTMEDRANIQGHKVPIPKLNHRNLAAMRANERNKEERV
jgi:hypothetical protein